ncbi:hypothetical protein AJ79_03669 [Helicocarpus griseus UAMH5409]|uniref:RING-type E3 ubiquitin transferase n=1 Tax=Helicocarpus griseus UAMH5409 TaxID=1447875 RepID=A0A2B7XWL3_9EURO|nr:hypothetical protein AJ79_03669 [Helicocarpus griseus UAMH5409]
MDLNRIAAAQDRRGGPLPDIMNDPAFATNIPGKRRSMDEPDTCRICRGEGTEEEQLFYPCKCSGSIKFVHQDCLMQWLSHSQKKYCELCKTPFRFTKLYDPNMPQELPAPLFFKELAVHVGRSFITWLRFVLVAFVWLGWLPWSMRAIWRGLFWLADGRWPNSESYQASQVPPANQALEQLAAFGTSPARALATNNLSESVVTHNITTHLPEVVSPFSSVLNFSAGEPLIYTVMKRFFLGTWTPASPSGLEMTGLNSTNATISSIRRFRQPSWLSDVSFLSKLTPYSTLNNILIDTFEGQIITLSVVIAFILVFLIREWVVQQQPAMNIAEGDREAAAQLIADGGVNRPAEQRQQPDQEEIPPRGDVLEDEAVALPEFNNQRPDNEPPLEQPYQPDHIDDDGSGAHDNQQPLQAESNGLPINGLGNMPEYRRTVDHTAEQTVESPENSGNAQWPGLEVFRDLWTRGARNPTEIVRIIEREGRQEELAWVIAAMQKLERTGELSRFSEVSQENERGNGREDEEPSASEASGLDTSVPRTNRPFSSHDGAQTSEEQPYENRNESGQPFTVRFGHPPASSHMSTDSFAPSLPRMEPFGASTPFDFEAAGPSRPIRSFDLTSPSGANRDTEMPPMPQQDPDSLDTEDLSSFIRPTEIASSEAGSPNQGHLPVMQAAPSPTSPQQTSPVAAADPPQSLIERASNWFWGGVDQEAPRQEDEAEDRDDERIVEDPAQEAPFVAIRNGHIADDGPLGAVDPDDADAVDDADDLEGIMELIGMQGPIVGLLQNGVFSALLVSFTVAVGIWLPYLWGKIALVLLTNPIRLFIGVPVAIASLVTNITVDTLLGSLGYVVYWANVLLRTTLSLLGRFIPSLTKYSASNAVTAASLSLIDGSSQRLKGVVGAFFTFHESDLPVFSVLSHQALRIHQNRITTVVNFVFTVAKAILHDIPLLLLEKGGPRKIIDYVLPVEPMKVLHMVTATAAGIAKSALFFLERDNWSSLKVGGVEEKITLSLNHELAQWDTKDRIIAILVGYCFASVIGMLYLRFSALFSGSRQEQRAEGPVAEILQQAGGVMKVILIIGIEMIVFPLYCGILLDIALLPLFESATLTSRTMFTFEAPFTSLFVHWFIGTCYMFHFALFVSMCRKIMRAGVLYFIRDPDDPTFHPVRDVLERNITTQLRKIAFSALVYGALVIICLGGVVWGLSLTFRDVLPIHWSSNEPVLEFPVDLLFYNFVMPLAIRSIRPSDGLQKMYDWWFHKCAHVLRLTHFLFGERRQDEEGRYAYQTWNDALFRRRDETGSDGHNKYFIRDGRFARAPGSDQVRIPKGGHVFLEVDENNERIDGKEDQEHGLHGKSNDMFAHVYIPPMFKTRIATFILMIWIFAAVTGLGCTVVPLVVGRRMISSLFPSHIRVNDLYAFSVGLYVVGGAFYAMLHCRQGIPMLRQHLQPYLASPRQLLPQAYKAVLEFLGLVYIGGAYSIFLPSLFALVTELYVLIPLHTYIGGGEAHVIHIVQDWTLGVLYVRMAVRLILWYRGSRPAIALNAVLRDGWLRPDIKLATRAFIVPATLATLIAILGPLPLGLIMNATLFRDSPDVIQSQVYRYCFPASLLGGILLWAAHLVRKQIDVWRVGIRDDVYLIGERLHNFGEKRAKDVGVTRRMITS